MTPISKPEECMTFFTAETLLVNAHVRDMTLPLGACVLVSVEATGPPDSDGCRTGWILHWYCRNPEIVAKLADRDRRPYESHSQLARQLLQEFSAPIPESVFPHAEAFASGKMPPGVFADRLLEIDENLFTASAQLLLRPYREAPEQPFQPVPMPKEPFQPVSTLREPTHVANEFQKDPADAE